MLSIGEMALRLGVSVATLRRWGREGKLRSTSRTVGNHRRYAEAAPAAAERRTVLYARVSSHDQKPDLERQKLRLLDHAAAHGWSDSMLVADLGSGMNFAKPSLLRMMGMVLRGEVARIVVENKDRLLRFGYELVAWICARSDCDLVITEGCAKRTPEETLARDVLEVITVFSSRLYGARSAGCRRVAAISA